MQQIEAISAHHAADSTATALAPAAMHNLATEQRSSVVAQLMLNANIVAEAKLAIPPTPAALLDISPAAVGLVAPVVTLDNHLQVLLLGEQSLEMIGTQGTHAAPPAPAAAAMPATAAVRALPGATLDTIA